MEGKQSLYVKNGIAGMGRRALMKAAGFTDRELSRPFIGIASSWTDAFPGHAHLDKISEAVAKGVYAAGGTPLTFSTIALCDGLCAGNPVMKFSLPSRELICDSVESVANAHFFDAIVLVASCDKIVPGMMMAACRLDIPAIIVTGGPMMPGGVRDARYDQTKLGNLRGRYLIGEATEEEVAEGENTACPGCGSCAGMFTANSMCCMSEVLGLALPGNGTIPAVDAARIRLAKETGFRAVELFREGLRPSDIVTKEALENAITLDMMIGCSTNTALHLPAIGNELGISVTLDDFDRIGNTTPAVCRLSPAGPRYLSDLHQCGGISALLKIALDAGMINGGCKTVTGKTIAENVANARPVYGDIIRPLDNPYLKSGGLTVLHGNIAPGGAVVKANAVSSTMFTHRGTARVFDSEDAAMEAVLARKIEKGNVIVVRYEGPKGGPGMREMLSLISTMQNMGYDEGVSLITDGRFSGITRGASIGHISPEAWEGGPIALIEEGDIIEYDIGAKTLNLVVSDEELARRRAAWVRPAPKVTKGWLARYASLVSSAAEGAIVSPKF